MILSLGVNRLPFCKQKDAGVTKNLEMIKKNVMCIFGNLQHRTNSKWIVWSTDQLLMKRTVCCRVHVQLPTFKTLWFPNQMTKLVGLPAPPCPSALLHPILIKTRCEVLLLLSFDTLLFISRTRAQGRTRGKEGQIFVFRALQGTLMASSFTAKGMAPTQHIWEYFGEITANVCLVLYGTLLEEC